MGKADKSNYRTVGELSVQITVEEQRRKGVSVEGGVGKFPRENDIWLGL